jgi:hypothetical protein
MRRKVLGVGLSLLFTGASILPVALAGETSSATEQGVQQRLERSIGMKVLTGEVWEKMSQDEKISFLWGAAHVIAIERQLMAEYPKLQRDNFSQKVSEGLPQGTTLNAIAEDVDSFYKSHPDEIQVPVVAVIWRTLVKPNLKTGIAGKPLG